MATQAISSYGIQLRLGDGVALAGVAVSGATNATPIVLTTAAHGIPVGDVDVMTVSGVGGNTGANGTWIVQSLSTTTVRLRGSVGNGAYTSGGTAVRNDTYTVVAELTNLEDAGLTTTLVDVSAHDSTSGYASRIPTFLNGNTLRVSYNLVPAHATHNNVTGLEFLMRTRAQRRWLIVFPDAAKSAWRFTGFVASDRFQAPVAGALTGAASLEMTDAPILTAA